MTQEQNQKRRTQQQRTADARELLSRAAFELIRDNGFANFRVAAVAKHAGVSQGGQLHHFPKKNDMTMAAIQYGISQASERTERNLADNDSGEDLITRIISDSGEYYYSASFDVALDIIKSTSHDDELEREIKAAHRLYRADTENSWYEKLCEAGWQGSDARDLIDLTTAIIRGFAIRKMIQSDSGTFDKLAARWHDMVMQSFPNLS